MDARLRRRPPTRPRTSRRGATCCALAAGLPARARGGRGDAEPTRPARLRTLTTMVTAPETPDEPADEAVAADEPTPEPDAASRPRCSPCATACRLVDRDPGHALRRYCDLLAAGTGPVAIDAERASGYRYSNRAYLVQLRREGAGTALVDPIAVRVPRAAQRGPRGHRVDPARRHPGPALPRRGRAAAEPRCSTPSSPAGCSASPGWAWRRWSRRSSACGCARSTPPPTGRPGRCRPRGWSTPPSTSRCCSSCARRWSTQLEAAGKTEWARQEFEALLSVPAHRPRGGVAAYLRGPQAPRPPRPGRRPRPVGGRATRSPASGTSRPAGSSPTRRSSPRRPRCPTDPRGAARRAQGFHGRGAARYARTWLDALARGPRRCPRPSCPAARPRSDGPPQPRAWAERDPVAARRLVHARGGDRPRWPRSTSCRWRTCSPPTTCAGCCGRRRPPASRRARWPRRWPSSCAGYGARAVADRADRCPAIVAAIHAGDAAPEVPDVVPPEPARSRRD